MINSDEIFLEYKKFIEENSIYSPRVVKNFTYKSTYFPILDFKHYDSSETNESTVDRMEYYDEEEFTIMIYAQDKGNVSRNVIINELKKLTNTFMSLKMNMRRTTCRDLPNLDADVGRLLMKYKCRWNNVYGKIWRR